MMKMRPIYGIDLGTTYTKCAFIDPDAPDDPRFFVLEPEVVEGGNQYTLRSVVTLGGTAPKKIAYVGARAIEKRDEREGASNILCLEESKRFIGGRPDGATGEEPPWGFEPHDFDYRPEDAGALVLRKVKVEVDKAMSASIGSGAVPMRDVVVTHPQYFDGPRREATRQAVSLADLRLERLLTEPDAAAIACANGLDDGHYLVFDIGGGTLDIVVLDIKKGKPSARTSDGAFQGGRAFDDALVAWLVRQYTDETGEAFREDALTLRMRAIWRTAAERIKCKLNSDECTRQPAKAMKFDVPFDCAEARKLGLIKDDLPDFQPKLSLQDYEDIVEDLAASALRDADVTLEREKKKWSDVTDVLLVGGSSRLRLIHAAITERLGHEPRKGINPDLVVAHGAALHGAAIALEEWRRENPTVAVPDALERAVRAGGSYRGALRGSLGLRATDKNDRDIIVRLIKKDSPLPVERPVEKEFYTQVADQREIVIHLYEGEDDDPEFCSLLGEVALRGLPGGPAKTPVLVRLGVEANGSIKVFLKSGDLFTEQTIEHDPDRVLPPAALERRTAFLRTVRIASHRDA